MRSIIILILIVAFPTSGSTINQCTYIGNYSSPTNIAGNPNEEICLYINKTSSPFDIEIFSELSDIEIAVFTEGQLEETIYILEGRQVKNFNHGKDSTFLKIKSKNKYKITSMKQNNSSHIIIRKQYEVKSINMINLEINLSRLELNTKSTLQNNNSYCQNNNTAPTSPVSSKASLNNNILISRSMSGNSFPMKLLWFKDMIANKQPWDFKQINSMYADYGNYHYGAVGAALGIPDEVLLRAAGWAQMKAGTTDKDWGHWLGFSPYGDDPLDQEWIKKGINYYKDVFIHTGTDLQYKYSDFCNDENNNRMSGILVVSPNLSGLGVYTRSFTRPPISFHALTLNCSGCHIKGKVTIIDIPPH